MSKYNIASTKSDHKRPKRVITTKPFCDCITCTCKDCPDVLKMLAITVTDSTCHFDSKVVEKKDPDPAEAKQSPNLLDVVNPNRSCNCDVVARGIRDNVHMNIGMSERRADIKRLIDECDAKCKQNTGSSETDTKDKTTCKICKP